MKTLTFSIFAFIIAVIIVSSSAYIIDQREQAIVFQFGKPKKVIRESGLHFKTPFIQNVVKYDKRILNLDPSEASVLLGDQKRIHVNSYARYIIKDPLLFYKSVMDNDTFKTRFGSVLNSNVRKVLGTYKLQEVLDSRRIAIMENITKRTEKEGGKFGVKILDVRISRTDLPDEISLNVYKRMSSERIQEANKERAEGSQELQRIKAEADKQATIIISQANQKSEIIRGNADAKKIHILGSVYGKDKDFFEFYRSLQAYRVSFKDKNTQIILDNKNKFLKYFTK